MKFEEENVFFIIQERKSLSERKSMTKLPEGWSLHGHVKEKLLETLTTVGRKYGSPMVPEFFSQLKEYKKCK